MPLKKYDRQRSGIFYFSGELKAELAAKRLERLAKDPKRYGNGWAYGRSVEVADCPDDSLYDGAQTSLTIQTINRIKNKRNPSSLHWGISGRIYLL